MSESKQGTKKEAEPVTVKGAVIVPPQLAEKVVGLFSELPRKFSPMIDPILQEFMQCSQADVVLTPTPDTSKDLKPILKELKK